MHYILCYKIMTFLSPSPPTFSFSPAITYECIRTIASIYPQPSLIQKAANAIARFLVASNNNWKYLGITALAALVMIEPKCALDHQLTVIECLDDPDETLKRKVSCTVNSACLSSSLPHSVCLYLSLFFSVTLPLSLSRHWISSTR